MRRTLILLCAAMALVAAGCGSSKKSSSSGTSSGSSSSGGGVQVKMQNIQFSPKDLTVKVGQKVTWVNDDSVNHNVTAQSGGKFKSTDFGQGSTFSFTPTKAGTIKYVCTLHPGMDGTLTVTG